MIKGPFIVHWFPPTKGSFKLNIDGASKGNLGSTSCGGVLRSHDCSFVVGFSCYFGMSTNTFVELSALKIGLTLCYQLSVPNLLVEKYSLLTVNWFNNNSYPLGNMLIFGMIFYILTSSLPLVLLVYREGNTLANSLANHEATGSTVSFSSICEPPKHVFGLFTLDHAGVPNFLH